MSRELGFRLESHLRGHMRSPKLGRTRGQVVVLQRWTRGQVVVHQRAWVHVGLDLLMFEEVDWRGSRAPPGQVNPARGATHVAAAPWARANLRLRGSVLVPRPRG